MADVTQIYIYIYTHICIVNLARTYGLDVTLLARHVTDVYPLAFASQVPAEG